MGHGILAADYCLDHFALDGSRIVPFPRVLFPRIINARIVHLFVHRGISYSFLPRSPLRTGLPYIFPMPVGFKLQAGLRVFSLGSFTVTVSLIAYQLMELQITHKQPNSSIRPKEDHNNM